MTPNSRLRVGLNGFGRIGRAVVRINHRGRHFEVVAVNDLDPNLNNHAYLLRYDSTYGRFGGVVSVDEPASSVVVDSASIPFYAEADIADVPWDRHDVDVVVDATGVLQNVRNAHSLVSNGTVGKVVVTHAPKEGLDATIIIGVNDDSFDPARHHVVSSSICDANAVAPLLALLDSEYGIEHGFVTTLHPWLAYQNLVDGSMRSVSSPTHFWDDFALGRASIGSLIPKQTSLMSAVSEVLPGIAGRVEAMSFRVPTGIVSASDLTIQLATRPTQDTIAGFLRDSAAKSGVLGHESEPLVSIDFIGTEYSAVIDDRWTRVNEHGLLKLVLWYDNEWGYSCRVVDTVLLVGTGAASGEAARAATP